MKLFQILTFFLASEVGAIGQNPCVSSITDTMSMANIHDFLAGTVEKSIEFATETIPQAAFQGAEWVAANPGTAAVYGGATGVGVVFVVAPALVAAPGLAVAGFGTNGIIAGSYAATIQSGIGSVVSHSLFAALQSAGAGGYGTATLYPAIQIAGGLITSSVGAGAWVNSRSNA